MTNGVRARRIALIGLKVAGIAVAGVAVLVTLTILILMTSWGGERLRRQAVTRVNQQIEGHLDIARLSFRGNRVVVWDVALRDPEGQVVAGVTRAEVHVSLLRVFRKEIRVNAIVIESPRLDLVSDSRGLNLSRATAPRKEAPPSPPPKPKTTEEGWVIRLDRFDLTGGDVSVTDGGIVGVEGVEGAEGVKPTAKRVTKAHLVELLAFLSARYATGNGSLDMTFRLQGKSVLEPVGPLRLTAEAAAHGDRVHFTADGVLLGGTIKARADLDKRQAGAADALLAVAIPEFSLAGHGWGPVRIDGQAKPGAVPTLDLSIAIPGILLTGKGGADVGNRERDHFGFEGRLALADLGLTAKAAHALSGGELSPMAGHGRLDFAVGGPMTGAPASWDGRIKGLFERLRFGETVISDLSIEGKTAHLSSRPGQASLAVAIASVSAGTTPLRGISLDAGVRDQDISVQMKVASPERIAAALELRLDGDRQGATLASVTLSYPGAQWATPGPARLRFSDDELSLKNFRLLSQGQALAIDGARTSDAINAHLVLEKFRLDQLPALVVDPTLHLGGVLDVDVKADGEAENPRVVARVRLQQARVKGFSKIGARVDATLADQKIDGTAAVEAPFAGLEAAFKFPMDPLAPGAPIDVRLDVTRLDLADALRGAGMPAQADGRLTLKLRADGSAEKPNLDLVVNGRDLKVTRPKSTEEIDAGHVRIRLTYADRAAKADIDFTSAHGGTLRVDAGARIDLGYPRVTRGVVVAKIPIHGKVAAKDFDVAWLAGFNERVETMGGKVTADAKLAGTVGDPQFIGDVRWKNGKVVTTAAPPPTPKGAAKVKRR